MNINITARHFKASDKLKKFAENELYRLQKFYDGIHDCKIIMDYVKGNQQKHLAEIQVNVYGQVLKTSEMTDDMYKSIDKALEKLERKLHKYKSRLRSFKHEKAINRVGDNTFTYEEE